MIEPIDLQTLEKILGTVPAIPMINEMDKFARSSRRNHFAAQAGDSYVRRMLESNVGEDLVAPYWDVYQHMIKHYQSRKLTYMEVQQNGE